MTLLESSYTYIGPFDIDSFIYHNTSTDQGTVPNVFREVIANVFIRIPAFLVSCAIMVRADHKYFGAGLKEDELVSTDENEDEG